MLEPSQFASFHKLLLKEFPSTSKTTFQNKSYGIKLELLEAEMMSAKIMSLYVSIRKRKSTLQFLQSTTFMKFTPTKLRVLIHGSSRNTFHWNMAQHSSAAHLSHE